MGSSSYLAPRSNLPSGQVPRSLCAPLTAYRAVTLPQIACKDTPTLPAPPSAVLGSPEDAATGRGEALGGQLVPCRASKESTLVCAGLVGSLLALAVVWAAPGNKRRLAQDFSGQHPHFNFPLGARSLSLSFLFLRNAVVCAPLTNALLVLVPALLAVEAGGITSGKGSAPTHEPRSGCGSWTLALLPIIGFFLILSSAVPFIVLGDRLPPSRARVIPEFVFVTATVCWSYLAGRVLRRSGLLRGNTRRCP